MSLGQQELGRRLKEARDAAGLTQKELADRIGLAEAQSISRYERGETEVPSKRLRRIAEETGKPLSFFVDDPIVRATEDERLGRLEGQVAELRDQYRSLDGKADEILALLRDQTA